MKRCLCEARRSIRTKSWFKRDSCPSPFEKGVRTHFALRFGQVGQEDGAVTQKKSVLAAFNPSFWPFVLTSTSIAQKGLDVHLVSFGRAPESAVEPSRYGAARRAGASL